MPREQRPAHLRQVYHQLGLGLMHGLTGAPDSSNCPPGSSEIAPPPVTPAVARQSTPNLLRRRIPSRPGADAAHAFIRNG
jgi:hypothetical protein